MCNSPCGSSPGACHHVPPSPVPPDLAAVPAAGDLCSVPACCHHGHAGMLRDVWFYASEGCWWAGPGPQGFSRLLWLAAVCHHLCPLKSFLDNILGLLAGEMVPCSLSTHVCTHSSARLANALFIVGLPRNTRGVWFFRAGQKRKGIPGFYFIAFVNLQCVPE